MSDQPWKHTGHGVLHVSPEQVRAKLNPNLPMECVFAGLLLVRFHQLLDVEPMLKAVLVPRVVGSHERPSAAGLRSPFHGLLLFKDSNFWSYSAGCRDATLFSG